MLGRRFDPPSGQVVTWSLSAGYDLVACVPPLLVMSALSPPRLPQTFSQIVSHMYPDVFYPIPFFVVLHFCISGPRILSLCSHRFVNIVPCCTRSKHSAETVRNAIGGVRLSLSLSFSSVSRFPSLITPFVVMASRCQFPWHFDTSLLHLLTQKKSQVDLYLLTFPVVLISGMSHVFVDDPHWYLRRYGGLHA